MAPKKRSGKKRKAIAKADEEFDVLAILSERWNPQGGSAKIPRMEWEVLWADGSVTWRPAVDVCGLAALSDYKQREARKLQPDEPEKDVWERVKAITGERFHQGEAQLAIKWTSANPGGPGYLPYEVMLGSPQLIK